MTTTAAAAYQTLDGTADELALVLPDPTVETAVMVVLLTFMPVAFCDTELAVDVGCTWPKEMSM